MTDITPDGAHSCGPHCERVPCLKRKISELEAERDRKDDLIRALAEKLDAVQDCDRCDALQAKLDGVMSFRDYLYKNEDFYYIEILDAAMEQEKGDE